MENIFEQITSLGNDGKINGKDSTNIDNIQKELQKDNISAQTRKNILDFLLGSLRNGFTITNEKDYEVLQKTLLILRNTEKTILPDISKLEIQNGVTTITYDGGSNLVIHKNTFWIDNEKIHRTGLINLENGDINLNEPGSSEVDDISNNNKVNLGLFFPKEIDGKVLPEKPTKTKIEENGLLMNYYGDIDESGRFQGEGIATWINGDVLTAKFKDGKLNGTFRMKCTNGKILTGEAKNNEISNVIEYERGDLNFTIEGKTKKEETTKKVSNDYLEFFNDIKVSVNWARDQILGFREKFDYQKLTKKDILEILEQYKDKTFPKDIENGARIIFAIQGAISIISGEKNNLGIIDGIYGPKTKKSLKKIQKEILKFKGKEIDGQPGKNTIEGLIDYLNTK